MNCERAKASMTELLAGDLDGAREADVHAHVLGCKACAEELEGLTKLWCDLDFPELEPRPHLARNFYRMLAAAQLGSEGDISAPPQAVVVPLHRKPLVQVLAAAAVLLLGVWIGLGVQTEAPLLPEPAQHAMQQPAVQRVFDQLSSDSAATRLGGIHQIVDLEPDPTGLSALLRVLGTDPNVNVRLAAVKGLLRYRHFPQVREAMILSLERDPSPLVQAQIVTALSGSYGPEAADVLAQFIQRGDVHATVRNVAQRELFLIQKGELATPSGQKLSTINQ